MQKVGYRLVQTDDDVEVAAWRRSDPPNPLVMPDGNQVCGASLNTDYNGWMLVEWDEPVTVFDAGTFVARATDAEYGAVLASAQTSVQVARWLDLLRFQGTIDVTSTTAQAAKAGLVAAGVLTQDRADVIFATA